MCGELRSKDYFERMTKLLSVSSPEFVSQVYAQSYTCPKCVGIMIPKKAFLQVVNG